MNLIGLKVYHLSNYYGTIIDDKDNFISVQLDNTDVKKFNFIKAFESEYLDVDGINKDALLEEVKFRKYKKLQEEHAKYHINIDFNNNEQEKTKTKKRVNKLEVFDKLILKEEYGNNGTTIYNKCIKAFEWKNNLNDDYIDNGFYFANKVSKENCSVIFIERSNLTKNKSNIIVRDNTISFFKINNLFNKDKIVVFVKVLNAYQYYGVFKLSTFDEKTKYLELELFDYKYPLDNSKELLNNIFG